MAQPGPQIDEKSRIADQLKRAFEGDAWHGPAVLEVLEGVHARTAASKPLAGAHSWCCTLPPGTALFAAAWRGRRCSFLLSRISLP